MVTLPACVDPPFARLIFVRVILQGSLEHFPAAELLPLLVSHKHGGTLDLLSDADGKRTRVFLREGRVDWTETSDGTACEEAILDLFAWTGGSFVLADEMTLPQDVKALELDPTVLIEEGIRRAAELRSLRPEQMFRVADNPAAQEAISLSPAEFKVLFRLGQGRTIAALRSESDLPADEIIPIVKRLLTNGLIQEVAPHSAGDETFVVGAAPAPSAAIASEATPPGAAAPHSAAISSEVPPPAMPGTTPPRAAPHLTQEKRRRQRTFAGSLTNTGESGDVHPLLDDELVIGRDPTSGVVISDGSVSSRHARILRTPEGFVIEDLQSRNGTFVNGERIVERRALADNDVVRFGRVILTFNVASEMRVGDTTSPQ
jgi:hypothetical protein